MATMIILQGKSNTGKTTTLRNLAKLSIKQYKDYELLEGNLEEYDFIIIIKNNDKTIGIVSMGDNLDLVNKLKVIYKKYNKIDLFYGASRTKGATVKIMNNMAKEQDATLIWTSTYSSKNNSKELNSIKAEELFALVNQNKIIF
jgi:stage III sporulation protein SpoIIIAA